jgi:hypothetical protein
MKRTLKVLFLVLVLLVMAMMAGRDSAFIAAAGFVAVSLVSSG